MKRQSLFIVHISAGLIILTTLIALTWIYPPSSSQLLPAMLFCGLIAFTNTFGVRLPAGIVSLLPMTTVAAYLVMGLVPAGWAAFGGTLIHGWIRARWSETLNFPTLTNRRHFLSLLALNATMHTGSILASGMIFQSLGGPLPLKMITIHNLPPVLALGFSFLASNHLLASIIIATRNPGDIKGYIQSLPHILFYEGAPLIFAPLLALIYTQLGVVQFVLFDLLIITASLITRSLALTSQRLERRIKELDSLQAVGQVLSASLNIDTILSEIHTQVAALMPARNFYTALYDAETSEVSFPLAFEDGQQVEWRSRQAGSGLTEYVLKTRQPLLIPKDVDETLERMGINQIGKTAASWLGVPILAEKEPIGVIAVQSYSVTEAYDVSHQEVLATIAAQAAVAIQNARLYERTDEALARRVQELASILRTTGEGILLLGDDYRVLTANRALANFLGIAQADLTYRQLGEIKVEDDAPLYTTIGFNSLAALKRACQNTSQDDAYHEQIIVVPGPPERHLERTLAPVRDREGQTTGWLFVFRDISEEIKLAQLQDDMTHMLIHDLRSPLTVLQGSLDMMTIAIEEEQFDQIEVLQHMARRGSDRMLTMVNELLDISKLESGELPLHPEAVEPESLLREIAARLNPLAREAHITLDLKIAQGLPNLYVDAQFIERVLHNLVDNAIKFTPNHGTVQLWAKAEPERENENMLLLGVTDNGPGIPPEEQPRLFEKFQQTSATGRRAGTGLGLPFCKLTVEAHGGEIWLESEVGKGATFIIRLPTLTPEGRGKT